MLDPDWISLRQAALRIAPCEGGVEGARHQLTLRLGWAMSRHISYPTDDAGRPLEFARPPVCFDDPMPRKVIVPPPLHPLLAKWEPASADWFDGWRQLWNPPENDQDWQDFNWQLDQWLFSSENFLVSWKYVSRAIVDRHAHLSDDEASNASAKVAWSFPEALAWIATGNIAETAIVGRHMASAGHNLRNNRELFGRHIAEGIGRLALIASERHCKCGAVAMLDSPRWKTCLCLTNAWTQLKALVAPDPDAPLPPSLPILETDLGTGWFGLSWPEGADAISFARVTLNAQSQGLPRFDDDGRRHWICSQPMMSADKAHKLYQLDRRYCGTKLPEFRKEWGETKGTKRGRQPRSKS